MTASQLTATEFVSTIESGLLIGACDSLGEEILASQASDPAFDTICLAFDTIVAELTARGLWIGEDS